MSKENKKDQYEEVFGYKISDSLKALIEQYNEVIKKRGDTNE